MKRGETRLRDSVGTGRVLVVDDDPSVRRTLARILQRDAHVVDEATDAASARKLLAVHPYTAMLCDLWMPGESGLSLATWAAEHLPAMAVLVVTASDDPGEREALARSEIEGFLTKPFDAAEILVNVRRAVERVGRRRQDEQRRGELEAEARRRSEELSRVDADLDALRRRLAERDGMWEALVAGLPAGILLVDEASRCYFANAAAERILERAAEDLGGHRWLDRVRAEDRASLAAAGSRAVRVIVSSAEGPRTVQVTLGPYSSDEGAHGSIVVLEEISELVAYQRELEYRSMHDEVTGLPNLTALTFQLQRVFDSGGAGVLAILELDRFEPLDPGSDCEVPAFDEGLRVVAERLRAVMDPTALVARTGSRELAVLATNPREEQGVGDLSLGLRNVVGSAMEVASVAVLPVASIGVASTRARHVDPDSLLQAARVAASRARSAGPNRVDVLDPATRERVLTRMDLESDLRVALRQGALRAVYQPVVTSAGGRLIGFEALCRWDHPVRGPIPPDVFVPIAEDAGLGPELGRYMLTAALSQMAVWDSTLGLPPDLRVGVNLTAGHLMAEYLPDVVDEVLARTGTDPSMLVIELTERSILADLGRASEALGKVRAEGVLVALDDFGTGYSSLGYLSRLPVDVVKVDRSFTAALGSSPLLHDGDPNVLIVRAIVSLARALGCEVVAEGVEQVEQRSTLVGMGVNSLQGYLFARPMAADDPVLLDLLADPLGPR